MKRIAAYILLAVFALAALMPVTASEAFDSAVEDSRSKGGGSGGESSADASTPSGSSVAADTAEELFAELLAILWLHNLCVRYASYPYSFEGEKAFVWENVEDFYDGEYKLHRYAVDTGAVWLGDMGLGNETRLDCMVLPFIGFRVSNALFCETACKPDVSGGVCASLQAPLIQTNPFSLYVDAGAALWYGDVHPLLSRGGFLVGWEVRSYPFKPLTLRWRALSQYFEDDVELFSSNIEAGVMLGRQEVFAGWKYMSVGNEHDGEPVADWCGAIAGARLYF